MHSTNQSAIVLDAVKETSTISKVALSTLILAKVFGLFGVGLAFVNHILGGTFLGLAIALIIITVYLCLKDLYSKQVDKDKETIDRLIKQGKINSLLKDAGYNNVPY